MTAMNDKFFKFCEDHGMKLREADGSLTVQGQAVMETNNCVVAAGAGSGKTTVLSYRFLRMVAQGTPVDRILTITFTKKATAEMKGRIYELLQKGHDEGLVTDQAMKKFSEVTISTVDSFCSEIVRRDAVHQGVPVDFSIQDDDDFKAMSNTIVNSLLEKYKDAEGIRKLHTYLKVDDIEAIFRDIAYKFLSIAKPFTNSILKDCLVSVQKQLANAQELFQQTLNLEQKDNRNLLEFISNGNDEDNLKTLNELYKFVQEYEQEIFKAKRAAGVLSFSDVMQLALKILTENKAIRDFYKAKFDSVMIDEFQDNNDDNRKLLYLLSEKLDSQNAGIPTKENLYPNKIFLVGDEKQSIYKFRGADVTVFKRLCTDLCAKPIQLKRNWRSEPAIINFCNTVFPEQIMPRSTTPCEDFEAQYEDLDTRPATPGLESKIVFLHPSIPAEFGQVKSDCETEAKVVASFIKELCSPQSTYLVPDDTSGLRPPRYNEIGLLLRASSHQALFEQALTAQDIPYTATEARSLMKGNLVNDFYNALQFCIYPYDKISFASYLKSPFCSFKDYEIDQVLNYKWQAMDSSLPQDLSARLKTAEDRLENLKTVIETGSICKMVDFLWHDLGYRDYMLSKNENRPYMEDFDNLYAIAVDYDNNGESIVAFLDYLRPLLNSNGKIEMNAVFKETINGVQIMTIHKSKGLAFKIVIVADMHSGARSGGGFNSEVYVDSKHNLSLRYVVNSDKKLKNPIFELHKAEEIAKENAEAKRVLYVAATRAKYHLIFSGADPTCKVSTTSQNSLLAYLLDAVDKTRDSLKSYKEISYKLPQDTDSCSDNKKKDYYKKIFDRAIVPALAPSLVRISVTHAEDTDIASVQTIAQKQVVLRKKLPTLACDAIVREHNFATGFGTLTHKIIEDNLKGLQDQLPADLEKIFSDEGQSFTEQEKESLISCANQLASNFLNGSLYTQIKDLKLMSEKKFLLYNGSSYVEGVIDLLAVGSQEAYILDFKTDSTMAEEDHKHQLEQYVNAVKSIYPQKSIRYCVCYLRDLDSCQIY